MGMKAMDNLFLLLYPGINVIVTGLFAGIVLRQYVQRHRLYQLYWGIALSMAFAATLAYVFMIVVQPASDTGVLFFRLYYILGAALMPFTIIVLNTLGVLAVVGVAIYSGWKLIQRQGTSSLLWANVLILAGDLINAAAGTTARLGVKNIFWLVMTFGWIVFFIGVLLASRPRRHAVTQNETSRQRMSAPDAVSRPH